MLEDSTIELVKQYLECEEQFSQSGDEVQRLACLHRDWGRSRLEDVQISLQQGKTSRKIEQVLICAQYLAYIVNFQPERASQLEGFRRDYLSLLGRGLCTSSEALRLFSMLCGGEEGDILLYLEEKLEILTSVSCPKEVSAYLSILQKRTQWILQQKSLTIAHISSSRLLEQSFKFLARYPHPQHPDLLHRMFSLANNLLLLASSEPRFANNNIEISKLAEGWLSMSVFKKETQHEQFKVLKQSFVILNPKNIEEYVIFVSKHISQIGSIRLLQLLKTILDKLQLVSKSCISDLGKIQKALFQSLLQHPPSSTPEAFRVKNLQVQLIVKLSSSYNCDINRILLAELRKTKSSSQYAFQSSLLFVFDSRLSAQTVKSIEGARLQYLHLAREQAAFEAVARHYCHTDLELDCFQIINPEILDQFMWQFLLLSTTITKNYDALCEIGKIEGLLANLIKIGLLGVYSDQCYQAIVSIVNHQGLYALDLQKISFADLIQNVGQVLQRQLNQKSRGDQQKISLMYFFLCKVFSLINSKYNILESSSLKLFNQLLQITPNIPQRCITNNLFREHYKILLQSIPKDLRRVTSQQINQAIQGTISHLTQFQVGIYMQIYLQMMLRALSIQPLKLIFQNTASSIQNLLLEGSIISRNLQDIYKINYFIMMKQAYNQQIVINCWDILLKVETLTYPHLAYYIIDLFNYFLEWALDNSSADEILVQIKLHLGNCLVYVQRLDRLILHTDFISRLETFLQLKQSALIFIGKLHQMAIGISFECQELKQLMNHLLIAAKEIRDAKHSSRFLKCKHEGIKKLWCDNQLMSLSLCLASTKGEQNRNPRHLLRDLLDLNQRFEWLRKVYPQDSLKNLDQLALYFNCELASLESRLSNLSLLLLS